MPLTFDLVPRLELPSSRLNPGVGFLPSCVLPTVSRFLRFFLPHRWPVGFSKGTRLVMCAPLAVGKDAAACPFPQ